ncbi:hypothetical protein ACFLS8_01615 [Chloroflexota bacterium]
MITELAAWVAVILFFWLMCFQILLALGFPYGKAAWGGKYIKLPSRLRIASLFSAVVFVVASLFVLEKANILSIFNSSTLVTVGVWILVAFFGLNTLSNLASKSKLEKRVMTPISLTLALLCLIVAITAN